MGERLKIISLSVDQISFADCLQQVLNWGLNRVPSYVCFANVHMTVEAYKDPIFLQQVSNASLIVTDGKPLTAACKCLYGKTQERIAGMDFTPAILELASEQKIRIFLYGSSDTVLEALKKKIETVYPGVNLVGAISPPFRKLTSRETAAYIDQINQSAANIVLVALGCPKQEKWMAENTKNIQAVLLGVGGAFPVAAGLQRRSPEWMQNWYLEWLYRLFQEPGRMFKRYIYSNSYFLFLLAKEWLKR